jgi:ribose transport system substrate-binding protein
MRKFTKLAFAASTLSIAAMALTGCGGAAQTAESSASADGKTKIVMVLNNQFDPFYLTLIEGAKEEAAKRGVDFSWQAPAEQSAANQIQVLQSVAAARPDGIIFSAADKDALSVPLKNVYTGGIPVITVDTDVTDAGARLMSVKSDGKQGGALAAETANEMLGGSGKVGYVGYTPGVESIDVRLAGWTETIKKYPGLENVGDQYAGLDIADNQTKASALLSRNPDLGAIYASWGGACTGAAQAVKQAGKTGQVDVICADAAPDQVGMLKSGDVSALVIQKAKEMGATALDAMLDHLDGGGAAENIVLDHMVATQENSASPEISKFFYVSKENQ